MKKVVVVLISILLAFQLQAQQSAKRYAIKSGKIEYQLTGSTTGTKTLYFDNYGNKHYEHEKSVTVTKMFGVSDRSEIDKITIINNDHFWTIDNIENRNYEGDMPYTIVSKQMTDNMSEAEQKKLADNILHSFGGQKLGTEKVLGYSCEKISLMGSLIWIYNGISLKSETKVMGITANEEASVFKVNLSIPSNKFKPSKEVIFTNIQQQQTSMYNGMNIEMFEEENTKDEEIVPVSYPFDVFKERINLFNPQGYVRTMVLSQDGQHMALFVSGLSNVVSVIATAAENMEDSGEMDAFETFSHNGKTMHYGDLSDEDMDGKALIIPYEEHDMFIIIMSAPGKDKSTLLKWADELNF